jgi:acyl-coenzyme A synthetase/AMP-(fatty) acid ligase
VLITILGFSRLGYAVLLLSTRLASPAIQRLLDLAECNTVLTTETFRPVLGEIQKEEPLILLDLLTRADYLRQDAPVFSRSYESEKETHKTAVIIHSSGSTGLPKPIYITHRSCIGAFATNLDMRALITSPLFHSQAFYETFRSIYSGKPIYYCNYSLPLTKQNLVDMIEHVKPDLLHCVPYVLKLLSESEEGVKCLAKVRLVLFAGSACPDDLGDRLVKSGVNLVANYGA